jgi:DNA-binding beta-propeller fold protein YncE
MRLLTFAALVPLGALAAQGEFVNFEVPQVKPIEIARINGHDYVLACNTPNNAVEIYDTSTNVLVASFKTGQGPVSVRYSASRGEVFTANFIGDSVTVARLIPGQWGGPPRAEVRRTSWVGDQPCDVAFFPDDRYLLVTMSEIGALSWWYADTLAPIGGNAMRMDLTSPWFSPAATKALKEPRALLVDGQRVFVLGHKGGNSSAFDHDLWSFDFATFQQHDLGGLGSINHGMVRARDGRLFTVGTLAQNHLVGESAVAAAPTGFVQSRLWVIQNPGTPGAVVRSRDLNRDSFGSIVGKNDALSQPTGVALQDSASGVVKVFVAGYHSDRLAVLHPLGPDPASWRRTTIQLPVDYGRGYVRTGPRGLAWKSANWSQTGDPGNRLYCLNQLDNSLSVIDPDGEFEVRRIGLGHDPTPTPIRVGRAFLYSANLSGSGFVACASCHVDGRSDSLGWNLGNPSGFATQPIDQQLLDGVTGLFVTSHYPDDKGVMVTQTLQGLVTAAVNPSAQHLFALEPYHWRGDRAKLNSFNGAYVTLLGGANVGTPNQPKGLTDDRMQDLVDMLNTIVHEPNAEQWIERRYLGELGDPDLEDGSDQLLGLKLFHTRGFGGDSMGGRSCVQCHSLPAGSNRRITEVESVSVQPMLTAGLRMLFQRDARRDSSAFTLSAAKTGEFGLSHFGKVPSLNLFVTIGFSHHLGDPAKVAALIRFLRAFDSGIAPLIGASFTIDAATPAAVAARMFDLIEGQVRLANVGLAVRARLAGQTKGYWFDLTASPAAYSEVGGWSSRSRASLLADLRTSDDVLVLEATPLGSERRIAAPSGIAGWLPGPAPSGLALAPMAPSSAWAQVPLLTKNWRKGTGPHDFRWDGEIVSGLPAPEPRSQKALRIFQQALIAKAPQLGLAAMRHEAPRRFAVVGNNIRLGARLVLQHAFAPASETIEMPLFPTDRLDAGRRRWETTVEADPQLLYVLLLGGPQAPDVQAALRGEIAEPPPPAAFDPLGWNRWLATVRNEDGTAASVTQALRIE